MSFESRHPFNKLENMATADQNYDLFLDLSDRLAEIDSHDGMYRELRHTLSGAQQRMTLDGLLNCLQNVGDDFETFSKNIVKAANEGRVIELDGLSDALWDMVETYDPSIPDDLNQTEIAKLKKAYFDVIRYHGSGQDEDKKAA